MFKNESKNAKYEEGFRKRLHGYLMEKLRNQANAGNMNNEMSHSYQDSVQFSLQFREKYCFLETEINVNLKPTPSVVDLGTMRADATVGSLGNDDGDGNKNVI